VKIVLSRTADADLLAGFYFYKKQGVEVAHYFLDSLVSDIDSLVLYAGVHRKIGGFHFMVSRRFPFAIYYKIENNTVRIRRVLDCRRNPDWIRKALKRG
jgi:plasmid stabilization system protein ParE